ncbi:2-hydroxyisoflavanone dehydratase-like [Andrographis paniculata]|uniref:2-hydroxyisoflavanone dehydratase-like n=1 Tax=Andrographis paniculata TaxID=175694 RepID=UPI0021E74A21|nr:2-hydroxyisoflavanone dehydratase-like [Andrographis paniculata]
MAKTLILTTFLLFTCIISCSARFENVECLDILQDVFPAVRVYKNGSIVRFFPEDFVEPAPNGDPQRGVRYKDVIIDEDRNVSARIFLPTVIRQPGRLLPVLIYYHGGGFTTGSPSSSTYTNYVSSVVARANVVAVSVGYRLAPEFRQPIAYNDAWVALKWVFAHAQSHGGRGPEPWLRDYGDFNRAYVGGDSAGGNIAHNTVLRAGIERASRIFVQGLFLNSPNFWGSTRIGGEEKRYDEVVFRNNLWLLVYPNVPATFDFPAINPSLDPNIHRLRATKLLLYVGGEDILRDRGILYVDTLRKSRWGGSIQFYEVPGEGHVFDILNPDKDKARRMLDVVVSFISSGNAI